MDIYVEPLDEEVMKLYEAAENEWRAGRAVTIATVISDQGAGARMLGPATGVSMARIVSERWHVKTSLGPRFETPSG